ncbi:MAG TPA: hypothetical protein VKX28_10440 [Xanthobacteraceae bacterium]|jgi:hypothetical protein|nr:hypothetical protein [Xanthobacteraceae bacterium]
MIATSFLAVLAAALRGGQPRRPGHGNPGRPRDVLIRMNRIVAKCSEYDLSVIVPVFEAVAIPPHGAMIAVACPACRATHWMLARDMRRRNDQRAA